MLRLIAVLALIASPALADEPVSYCSDDVPYGIVEYEGEFFITQQHGNDKCVRVDAIWYECNERPDYRLAFQVSEDGSQLELRAPGHEEIGRFDLCQ